MNSILRLASSSPRRRQLLEALDLEFTVHKLDYDESHPTTMNGRATIQYIVGKKLDSALDQITVDGIILCADTIVLYEEKIMEKPDSIASANEVLRLLSGKEHRVLTAVAMSDRNKSISFVCESLVQFSIIPEEDIAYYTEQYAPLDKAGSYGIQEWIGHAYIERITGSYNNIMGLPTHKVYQELKRW